MCSDVTRICSGCCERQQRESTQIQNPTTGARSTPRINGISPIISVILRMHCIKCLMTRNIRVKPVLPLGCYKPNGIDRSQACDPGWDPLQLPRYLERGKGHIKNSALAEHL